MEPKVLKAFLKYYHDKLQLLLTIMTLTLVLILFFGKDLYFSSNTIMYLGLALLGLIYLGVTELFRRLKLAHREQVDVRQYFEERVQKRTREQEMLVKELTNEMEARRKIENVLSNFRQEEDIRQRKKLASELHDIIGQNLQCIKLLFKTQQKDFSKGIIPASEEQKKLLDEIELAIKHVRQMTKEIYPIFLEHTEILQAIQSHSSMVNERDGLSILIDNDNERYELDYMIKEYCFLIYQEILNNVVKHANATQVIVKLIQQEQKWFCIQITDNGKGFNPESIKDRGHGLVLIKDRTHDIGGSLEIKSVPEEGTSIYIKVPSNA